MDVSKAGDLFAKGLKLEGKGRFSDAYKAYSLAVDASRQLGQPDCLIVASLQLACVNVLSALRAAGQSGAQTVSDLLGRQDEALAILRARIADKSVGPGKCRPHEDAFCAKRVSCIDHSNKVSPAGRAEWSTLLGYEALLRAASNVLQTVLANQGSTDITFVQQHSVVLEALAALTRRMATLDSISLAASTPPTAKAVWVSTETLFATSLRNARTSIQPHSLLHAAWMQFEGTGAASVFERSAHQQASAMERLVVSRHEASAQQRCALPSCGKPDASSRCSACRLAYYCCRDHQVGHWAIHKLQCVKKPDQA